MQRIENMAAKPAALKFLTCKAQSMWLYGVDTRRKLSEQNSPPETSQGQWFPSLLGWSPGNPATRRDPCQQLEKADLFLLSLNVSAYSLDVFCSCTFPPRAHWGGKQTAGRRDAARPVQHQGKQLSPLPFSGWLENYLPVGWFPNTCSAPLWIFMLLY